mgnify:CR=1 FL=1
MTHEGKRLAPGLEPRHDFARVHPYLDHLDGDLAAERLRLLCMIDDSHPAFTEHPEDSVGADAWGKVNYGSR